MARAPRYAHVHKGQTPHAFASVAHQQLHVLHPHDVVRGEVDLLHILEHGQSLQLFIPNAAGIVGSAGSVSDDGSCVFYNGKDPCVLLPRALLLRLVWTAR
eukprot:1195309-Prorocentrum_minimum.AAC.2